MNSFISKTIQNRNSKYLFIIPILVCTALLFVFRTAIPFLKYPFIVLYFLFIVYYLFINLKKLNPKSFKFIHNYSWVLLLSFILLIAFVLSNKFYLNILKDLANIVILLSLFFILNSIITTKELLSFFLNNLVYFSIFFAFIISIISLYGIFGEPLTFNYLTKDIDKIDPNFASIPLFFGVFGIIYLIIKRVEVVNPFISNLLLFVFTLGILFSGSRRGSLLLVLIILFLVFAFFLNLLKKKSLIANLGKKTSFFLLILLILFGIIYLFIVHTSGSFKTNTLRIIGTQDIPKTKQKISSKVYRLSSLSYPDLYELLWTPSFDPDDPDNGWGTRKHKTVFPLEGKNKKIVPGNAKGYYMDASCNASTWSGNAYSYSIIGHDSVIQGDQVQASVYCYVSSDFDGTWVRLSSEGATYGDINSFYDLKNKDSWQKLNLKVSCKNGKAPVYLYFSKYGVSDFSTLKGHVIFAYPQYKVIKKDSLQSFNILNTRAEKTPDKENLAKAYIDTSIDKEYKPNLLTHNLLLNLSITPSNYYQSKLFSFSELKFAFASLQNDSDPIRNWVANFVAEDSTYLPYKAVIEVDSVSDRFIAPRTVRWQFAWQIYTKEYNWVKKIFGGGFAYLNWYGFYFLKDKTASDWPHNPFLSVLLYSGILGLIIYLIFLYKVFYLYIKYIKEYYLLFIFFLITFYFSFFSGNIPFDPPVTGFFVMLPFFIHAVHKNEKKDTGSIENF